MASDVLRDAADQKSIQALPCVGPDNNLDHDLGLLQRVEDLSIQAFILQLCAWISASLQACGGVFPFAICTSICRNTAMICSGLYFRMDRTVPPPS